MMANIKEKKIVLVKMPSFTRLLIGGLAAYWLSTIMNPAFVAIAVLVILLIPILTVDNIFSRQFSDAYKQPEQIVPKVMKKSEYLASIAPPVEPPVAPPEPEKESTLQMENRLNAEQAAKKKSKSKH
ncbi:MAG: hypothetical protein WCI06_08450 [Methylococcaceae bacterium]